MKSADPGSSNEEVSSWPQDISEQWSDFEGKVMPPGAPPTQRSEMKKAFLSGYMAAMLALQEVPAGIPDDEGADRLEEHFQNVQVAWQNAVNSN